MNIDPLQTITLEPKAPNEATLYLVPTPIGNLKDITIRSLETLHCVDIIACEDTRVTTRLLNHYQIKKTLQKYNDFSDHNDRKKLLHYLEQGQSVALVSDAGTPLISDPGYKLIKDAIDQNHKVISLPGANAPTTALVASGLSTDQFSFLGFLPSKTTARQKMLQNITNQPFTTIVFETAKRLIHTLQDIQTLLPQHPLCVAREISKTFEEYTRGNAEELLQHFTKHPPKGEIVILIGKHNITVLSDEELETMLQQALTTHPTKEAVTIVAQLCDRSKKELYDMALAIKSKDYS